MVWVIELKVMDVILAVSPPFARIIESIFLVTVVDALAEFKIPDALTGIPVTVIGTVNDTGPLEQEVNKESAVESTIRLRLSVMRFILVVFEVNDWVVKVQIFPINSKFAR